MFIYCAFIFKQSYIVDTDATIQNGYAESQKVYPDYTINIWLKYVGTKQVVLHVLKHVCFSFNLILTP